MAKNISKTLATKGETLVDPSRLRKIIRETGGLHVGGPRYQRSVKSPPKSGSVSSAAVERAVKKVASRRTTRVSSGASNTRRPKL